MQTSLSSNDIDDRQGLLENLQLQGRKIQELLSELEQRAAHTKKVEAALVEAENQISKHREAYVAWRETIGMRLGSDFPSALAKLDLLIASYNAMPSPAHRLVSFIERRLAKSSVGRFILRLLDKLYLFIKA